MRVYLDKFSLAGRTAFITGGGRGIGLATADALLDAGAKVIISGHDPAVLEAGATVHDHQPSESGSFRVYLDPAGHPFCLCRS